METDRSQPAAKASRRHKPSALKALSRMATFANARVLRRADEGACGCVCLTSVVCPFARTRLLARAHARLSRGAPPEPGPARRHAGELRQVPPGARDGSTSDARPVDEVMRGSRRAHPRHRGSVPCSAMGKQASRFRLSTSVPRQT